MGASPHVSADLHAQLIRSVAMRCEPILSLVKVQLDDACLACTPARLKLLPRGVTSLARSITEHQLQLVAVKLTKGNASGIIYHGEECLALTAQGMHTTLSKVSHEGHFCGHIHSSLASG